MNLVGKVLAERYEILEEIGVGGMAVVYKARCLVLNRYVAIKVLRDDLKDDQEFVNRFNVEAQAAASLAHPNIVSIFDVGNRDDLHYIVMEYVEGQTLKEYIDEKHELPWREAVDIAMQICKGLEVAHKNSIVHRDIKPHNIMRTSEGIIKVTDFGIARANSQKTMTVEKTAIGSVHYISPEQARGGYVDHRSDLYSLGIVLYEMLTGRIPFDDENSVTVAIKQIQETPVPPSEYNISIPRPLEQAVLKAIAKEPSARFADAAEFYSELNSILSDPDRISNTVSAGGTSDETKIYKTVDVKKEETIIMPKIEKEINKETDEDDKNMKRSKKSKDKKDIVIDKNKERKVVILAILSSLVVIFLLLYSLASLMGLTDLLFSSNNNVEVPSLVGLTFKEANETYAEAGFSIIIGEEIESEEETGKIVKQSPESGKKIKKSDEMVITVYVSAGSGEIVLDNYLKYTDRRNVELDVKKYGLKGEFIEESSDEIPSGAIIRQVPKPGSVVKKGDLITFYVSTGPEEKDDDENNNSTVNENNGGNISGSGTAVKPNEENKTSGESNQSGTSNENNVTGSAEKKSTMLTVYGPKDKESALVQVKVNGSVVYSMNMNKDTSKVVKLESQSSTVEVEILYDGVSKQKGNVTLN